MTITGQSSLDKDDIDQMVKDAEAHAEEDRRRREEAEVRNQADTLVYQTEKLLREQGDKITGDEKDAVEATPRRPQGGQGRHRRRGHQDRDRGPHDRQPELRPEALRGRRPPRAPRPARVAGAGASAPDDDEVVDAEIVDDDSAEHACAEPTSEASDGRGRRRGRRSTRPPARRPTRRRRPTSSRRRRRPDDVDLPTALAQRDEYLALARRVQADFENFRKRTIKQQHDQAAAATAPPRREPAAGARRLRQRGHPRRRRRRADPQARCSTPSTKAGLEVVATDGAPFDPTVHEAVLHEPGDGGEPTDRRGAAHRLPVERPYPACRHGQGQGLTRRWPRNASGSRRTTTRSSASPRSAPPKDIKARTASCRGSSTPTPTPATPAPRSASRRSPPPTTSLGDEAKRKEYDEVRRLGPMGGAGGGGPAAGGFTLHQRRLGDLGDLLGGLFNRGRRARRGGGPAPSRGTGPQRGADLESRAAAVLPGRGVAASRPASTSPPTSPAAPATAPAPSPARRRRPAPCAAAAAWSTTTRASSRSRRRARNCRGQGFVVDDPCPTCRGTGTERKARQVKVRVPAGVQRRPAHPPRRPRRARPQRRAATATSSSTSGSAEHPLFGRKGDDLTLTVPITFPEAALGADVVGAHPRRADRHHQGPARHPVGPHLPGEGHGARDAAKRTGDLLVTVEVAVPSKLIQGGAQGGRGAGRRDQHAVAPDHLGVVSRERLRTTDGRLRHLGRRRARRRAPADPAHLRAQGPRRSGPHRRRQPPLQRRRHRPAASHPGAHHRRAQPRRRAEGAGARGRVAELRRPARRAAPAGRRRPSRTRTASTGATSCR